ncbi:hypothetical protein K3495_g3120 [Podosphaera aphanis]|nr:hypothetical protein K3495_g3120 [Podosphaera aphanis]
MAFHQPTLLASRKRTSTSSEHLSIHVAQSHQLSQQQQQQQQFSNSQEWILFDPPSASATDHTNATFTARTPTVTRSQVSDFGSFETGLWSYDDDEALDEDGENEFDEDGELDSLDSHLLEFSVHTNAEAEPSRTVLPTHDGLGSFRLDRTAMGDDVQEHLYKFERFNPRRVQNPRESPELSIQELSGEKTLEAERIRRIEMWTLQQSRVLVDEIKRESRREQNTMNGPSSQTKNLETEDASSSVDNIKTKTSDPEREAFWKRITRRFIRDLIGIDDNLLSVLFGESLPYDSGISSSTAPSILNSSIQKDHYSWEVKLIERIAHELDILAHHMTDSSASSKGHLYSQDTPLSYAGLPIIPETKLPNENTALESSYTSNSSVPEFNPTIQTSIHAQPTDTVEPISQGLTREDWERDLDLKMVFKYIRDRVTNNFCPSSSTLSTTLISSPNRLSTTNTAANAARAARVRQQHPLVSGKRLTPNLQQPGRTWRVSVPTGSSGGCIVGSSAMGTVSGKANVASGTPRNRRESSSYSGERIFHSGSSRHYWDWAGSVGSGNAVAGIGAMESWGEV